MARPQGKRQQDERQRPDAYDYHGDVLPRHSGCEGMSTIESNKADIVRQAEDMLERLSTEYDEYFVVNTGGVGEYDKFCCLECTLSSASLYMMTWHAKETGHRVRRLMLRSSGQMMYTPEELQGLYDDWHPDPNKKTDKVSTPDRNRG